MTTFSGFRGGEKIRLLTGPEAWGLISGNKTETALLRDLVGRDTVLLGVLVENSESGFDDSDTLAGFSESIRDELIVERERERGK